MDYGAGRADPLREGGNFAPEGGIVDLVDKKAEEGGGLIARIRLKLRVDLYYECGSNSREQTSLIPVSACS